MQGLWDTAGVTRIEAPGTTRKSGHDARVRGILRGRAAGRLQESLVVIAHIRVIDDEATFKRQLELRDAFRKGTRTAEAQPVLDAVKGHAVVALVCVVHILNTGRRKNAPNVSGELRQGVVH